MRKLDIGSYPFLRFLMLGKFVEVMQRQVMDLMLQVSQRVKVQLGDMIGVFRFNRRNTRESIFNFD